MAVWFVRILRLFTNDTLSKCRLHSSYCLTAQARFLIVKIRAAYSVYISWFFVLKSFICWYFLQRQGIMILMHAAAPYLLDRLLANIEMRAKSDDCSPELARFSSFIPVLRNAIVVIHRCHLALFYLRGIFYHISKRLAGTKYVSCWLW